MASRKNLKKDIDYLTYEVVSDCLTYVYLNPNKKEEEALAIIEDMTETRNALISKVNNVREKDIEGSLKSYFKNVSQELLKTVDESFARLSSLTR